MSRLSRILGFENVAQQNKDAYGSISLILPQWQDGQIGETAKGYANAVRMGYRRNELLYACITMRAGAAASVSLKVYNQQGEDLDQHPLRKLIQQPNPFMSESDFWGATSIMRDLSGHAYWQIIRSKARIPVQLWPLRPDWIAPVQRSGGVQTFKYEAPGTEPQYLDARDVLDFKTFDPLDMLYGGVAPIAVASRVGDADNATTDFIKAFFEQGAFPAGLLTSSQKLNDQMVGDIRRRWTERYGGWRKWLEPAVLDSDAKYQQIGLSFKEMGFEALDERAEARVCMIMRVPGILIGSIGGMKRSTYDNYQSARLAWWEDQLYPDFQHLKDTVENRLLAEFDPSGATVIEWDYSKVPALQENQSELRGHALASFNAGSTTLNEYRAVLGLPSVTHGDVFYIPNTVSVTPVEAIIEPPENTPGNEPDADDEPPLEDDETGEATPDGDEPASQPATDGKAMQRKADPPPDDAERRREERELALALADYFSGQRGRVTQAVKTEHDHDDEERD